MPSFYLPLLKKTENQVTISGEEFHHIRNVFKKKIGDNILLNNGKGLLAKANIIDQSKKNISCAIINFDEKTVTNPRICVAFSLLKNKHDFLIVEKLSELGVKEFFPFESIRTVRKCTKNTIEKFEKISIAAIKQCDNAFLPIIHPVKNLFPLIESFEKTDCQLFYKESFGEKPICIFIGPEGGFSDEEFTFFKSKNKEILYENYFIDNYISCWCIFRILVL